MRNMSKLAVLILFAGFLICSPVRAQIVRDAHTEAELVSEVSSIKPGEPFWLGLRLKTDPHWHTYWRNPGDSGLATTIKWMLPEGFKASPIQWPYPRRIDIEQLTGYGYEDEVVLLTQIMPPDHIAQNPVEIKARADWLACEVPCVPGRGDFTLTLPVSDQAVQDPKWKEVFETHRGRLPLKDPSWSFTAIDQSETYLLDIQTTDRSRVVSIEFFPFNDGLFVHAARQNVQFLNPGHYQLTLTKNLRGQRQAVETIDGIVTIYREDGPAQAIEVNAKVGGEYGFAETARQSVSAEAPPAGLWIMLIFAFFGGMILNLMPCVFPVLSIKVLSFAKHAQNRSALIKLALGYTIGVVASFAALALVLMVLRKSGEQIGWGFQFQSPVFVVSMILLLYVMALNLFGLFEVIIPGISGRRTSGQLNFSEALFGGILATIVATPCTAPFMGTAMSFALTQSAMINLLVFVSLGLGMAFPFVLLCLFPLTLKFLPKPGAWMENFKKFLAFPLLSTVIWLLWVLEAQKGFETVMLMLSTLLMLALGIWMLSVVRRFWLRAAVTALMMGVTALSILNIRSSSDKKSVFSERAIPEIWRSYNPEEIRRLEADQRVIFYDFTARWCLTCQANERVVLADPDILKAFEDRKVALIKADWTRRDEDITRALKILEKNSVPVYVLSYPSEKGRITRILPELLTRTTVLEALSETDFLQGNNPSD